VELRDTFNNAAASYQRARPEYPEALFDDLVALAGLRPNDRLLEIGCATGKATMPLARRGFRITAIELGAELAAVARENCAPYPGVEIVNAPFESWTAPEPFALVYAATAWHWIDKDVRFPRAHDALQPGGHLAFWGATHAFPDGGDSFFADIQPVYDEIGEGLPPGAEYLRPDELPDERADIEASGLFDDVHIRRYGWETVHDADSYIALLDTFSGHIAMEQWQRDRLYGAIREKLSEREDGLLHRGWGAVLHIAQKVG
jgi:SAM-dependent methyltransferase